MSEARTGQPGASEIRSGRRAATGERARADDASDDERERLRRIEPTSTHEVRAGARTEIRAELVIELAPGIRLAIEVPADAGITLTPDDVDALRARAVDLVELTRGRLAESTFHRNPRTNENEGDER